MALATPPCMMAAALIPLMFILGLVVLFAVGAWPLTWPMMIAVALLVVLAIGLGRLVMRMDEPKRASR